MLLHQSEIIANTGNDIGTDFYKSKWKAVHFQNCKQGTVLNNKAKKEGGHW